MLSIYGDRVAAEAKFNGELTNGRVYNNLYHYLFEFDNGKIVKIEKTTVICATEEHSTLF